MEQLLAYAYYISCVLSKIYVMPMSAQKPSALFCETIIMHMTPFK